MVATCLGPDPDRAVPPLLCQDHRVRISDAVDLSPDQYSAPQRDSATRWTKQRSSPAVRAGAAPRWAGSAPERVMAAELGRHGEPSEALSMMVSSMVRMVQAGRTQSLGSRWSA